MAANGRIRYIAQSQGGVHPPVDRTDMAIGIRAPFPMSPSLALIVARTDWNAQAVETIVEHEFVSLRAASAHQALQLARTVEPDIVLVHGEPGDLPIPDFCAALTDAKLPASTPVVVIAPDDLTSEQRDVILRAGAWEVVREELEPSNLLTQLRRFVAARREVVSLRDKVLVDTRTGMYNQAGLVRRATEAGAYAYRHRTALAFVALLPIVEQEVEIPSTPAAHAPLDEHLARVVMSKARESDAVGWTGTRELAIVALGTDSPGALSLVHRLRQTLRREPLVVAGAVRSLSVSASVFALADFSQSSMAAPQILLRTMEVIRSGGPQLGDSVRVLDDVPIRQS